VHLTTCSREYDDIRQAQFYQTVERRYSSNSKQPAVHTHCVCIADIQQQFRTELCNVSQHLSYTRHHPPINHQIKSSITMRCYASAVLAMGLCLSVTSWCSIEMAERIELVLGMCASFYPSYTVLKGISVISKNKGTPLCNSVLNSGLRKFCHGILIVETCYQLSSIKMDAHSVINWAVVVQLSR